MCAVNVCTCASGGDPATAAACTSNGAVICGTCGAGFGFVSTDSSCEECADITHPEYNTANDKSPCGQHTACTAGQRFEFSASSGEDRCEACAAGKYQSATSHFETACEVTGMCTGNTDST